MPSRLAAGGLAHGFTVNRCRPVRCQPWACASVGIGVNTGVGWACHRTGRGSSWLGLLHEIIRARPGWCTRQGVRHADEPAYNKKGKCYMSEHTSHPAQGLNRLTIAQQISLLAGVAVLALVVILALSLVRVQQLGATVEELGHEQVERLQLALRWRSNIAVNATRVLSITQTDGDDLQGYFKDVMGSTTADTTKVQQRYTELEKAPVGCAFRKSLPPCASRTWKRATRRWP